MTARCGCAATAARRRADAARSRRAAPRRRRRRARGARRAAPCRARSRRARPARLFPRAAWKPGVVLGLASFGYGTVNAFARAAGRRAGRSGCSPPRSSPSGSLGSRLVDDLGPRRVVVASAALEGVALGASPPGSPARPARPRRCGARARLSRARRVGRRGRARARARRRGRRDHVAAGTSGSRPRVRRGAARLPGDLGPAFALAAGLAALAALGARRAAMWSARGVARITSPRGRPRAAPAVRGSGNP